MQKQFTNGKKKTAKPGGENKEMYKLQWDI